VIYRQSLWLIGALVLAPSWAWAESAAHVPVPTDAAVWKMLPPAEEGAGQPLPAWIRALAVSLPKTAAAMINLDYTQRVESTLPPRLRAELRWIAADANRCAYAKAYARFDYVWADGKPEDIDTLPRRMDQLPEAERLALQFVRQLAEAAYTVTDAQVARLVELYGNKQVVAIVLVAAYANFQDRLLLALGVSVEPKGPLPPVKVRFRKSPSPAKSDPSEKDKPDDAGKEAPKRTLSPPSKNPPPVPEKVEDPEWTALPYETLQKHLAGQKDRRRARIPIPDWKTVRDNLPAEMPRDKPIRIRWNLINYGYQPRLNAAWIGGLRAFRKESDLSIVQQESMFWVVTRSLQCFY
jgi:alkylhydroperoxidase family enzyme